MTMARAARRRLQIVGATSAVLAITAVLTAGAAQAHTSVGVGIGIPLFGSGYYEPAYPPAYPYDYNPYPPAYYVPQPEPYGAPPPAAAYDAPPPPEEDCRETRVPATIGGRQQWLYGTACRQPDGSWRNVD